MGRSRNFWTRFFPRVQELFPDRLRSASLEDFYRAIVRYRRKETIVVLFQRKTQRYYITLRFGRPENG